MVAQVGEFCRGGNLPLPYHEFIIQDSALRTQNSGTSGFGTRVGRVDLFLAADWLCAKLVRPGEGLSIARPARPSDGRG